MKVPLLDLKVQFSNIESQLNKAIRGVLEDCRFIMGPNVSAFEREIADYLGVKHAIGVANGTDALLISLHACNIGEGDEVITTPFTFFATAEAVSQRRAVPVFVDIDPDSCCIDPGRLREAITPRTKAVIPVHIFGQPAAMDEIMKIAGEYKLVVIEDACQAIGSEYRGKKVGTIGHTGCFSFFPTKNLGGFGDGGLITTNDASRAELIRRLRVHGSNPKYYHSMIGYNSRLDEIQAALLRIKLKYLDHYNRRRREIAKYYNQAFSQLPIGLPRETEGTCHVFHLYMIRVENRDDMMRYLKEKGIGTGLYYPVPLHLQEVYRGLGYKRGQLPISEAYCDSMLALPCYPELTKEQQDYVVEAVKAYFHS